MQVSRKTHPALLAARLLMAAPLLSLFAYTALYMAVSLNVPLLLLMASSPFVSRALSERKRSVFYFLVEMVFMFSVLYFVFGATGNVNQKAIGVYSIIMTGEFALPFIFAMEVLHSRSPSSATSWFILGFGIILEEIATIAYAIQHSTGIIQSYIDVWSLQITAVMSLLATGYQSGLPLQSLNIPVSAEILLLLFAAVAGFFIYLMDSEGDFRSVRIEQAAVQLAGGSLVTIAVLSLLRFLPNLSIAVISAAVLLAFLLIFRIASRAARAKIR